MAKDQSSLKTTNDTDKRTNPTTHLQTNNPSTRVQLAKLLVLVGDVRPYYPNSDYLLKPLDVFLAISG